MTCSSAPLYGPLLPNCSCHVVIPCLYQLFPNFSTFKCVAPFEVPRPVWGVEGGCCETVRQTEWESLKHIEAFGSHLLCIPWRTELPFQPPAESNIKMKNNHVRVNPDKTEQSLLGRGKHIWEFSPYFRGINLKIVKISLSLKFLDNLLVLDAHVPIIAKFIHFCLQLMRTFWTSQVELSLITAMLMLFLTGLLLKRASWTLTSSFTHQ